MRCIIATTSFHVVDQTGVGTATVSGNLYLQLVVENDVPSSPVLGATVHVSNIRGQGAFVCLLCIVSPGLCSAFTGFYSALPICNYVFMCLIKRGIIPRLFQGTFTCS